MSGIRTLLIAVLALATLSGCAQQRIANEAELDNTAARKAESFVGDSRNALDDAEDALRRAATEDLEFFTPLHWQQINDAIRSARKQDASGNQQAAITSSALVTTLLSSALDYKARISTRLADLLNQRQVLLDIRADKVQSKDFDKQNKRIRELASLLETGKDKDMRSDITDILADMREIEQQTMLELHWRPARKTLDKAEDEGVDDFAPETFSAAERLTDEAEDTISEQFQNRELSTSVGLTALRAAQHALYIGREAERIINMDLDDAEQAALRFEGFLNQIGEALGTGDLRNMAFQDQTLALIQKARELHNNAQAPLQKEINQLQQQLQAIVATQANNAENATSSGNQPADTTDSGDNESAQDEYPEKSL